MQKNNIIKLNKYKHYLKYILNKKLSPFLLFLFLYFYFFSYALNNL